MVKYSAIKTREELENLKKYINEKKVPENLDRHGVKRFKKKAEMFLIRDEQLLHRDNSASQNHLIVIALEENERLESIIKDEHMKSHAGMNKMFPLINSKYYCIPRDIIRKVCSECVECKKAQPFKNKSKQKPITSGFPFERIQIDLVDLSRYESENDGFKFLLNVIDVYSKFAFSIPLKNKSGEAVLREMERLCLNFGFPKILQCDNGKEFINKNILEFWEQNKVIVKRSRPRHPQTNGQVERFNQTLTRWLSKNVSGDNKRYINNLQKIVFEYNKTEHSATKKSPFKIFFGRSPTNNVKYTPNADAESEFEDINNEKYIEKIEVKNLKKNDKISEKDLVLLKKDFDNNVKTKKLKLESFNEGPFLVSKKINDYTYELELEEGKKKVVNISQIKKFN